MTKSMREQLIAARNNLRRQIEILQSPATPAGVVYIPDNREMIASLEAQIRELSEALANLDRMVLRGKKGTKRPGKARAARGTPIVAHLRGRAGDVAMSTDEIMALTRGDCLKKGVPCGTPGDDR